MNKLSSVREFFEFLKSRKKWWLIVFIVFLFALASLVFLSQGSAISPFIYTIF